MPGFGNLQTVLRQRKGTTLDRELSHRISGRVANPHLLDRQCTVERFRVRSAMPPKLNGRLYSSAVFHRTFVH